MSPPSPSKRFRLWVDGCGGFLLVLGDRARVGRGEQTPLIQAISSSPDSENEIAIQADLPRRAGTLQRKSHDYFWIEEGSASDGSGIWIESGSLIPLSGSANLTLTSPSLMTSTAMLSLKAPHRFFGHIDQVALVSDVLLIGSTASCHIRVEGLAKTWILRWADAGWQTRILRSEGHVEGEWQNLHEGESFEMDDVSMMLELV